MTGRATSIALPILLIWLLLGVGCAPSDENTPGAAVQVFYGHLNEGRTSAAMAMYDAEASRMFEDPAFASEGAFDDWAESETKKGSISTVEIEDASSAESTAEVKFRVEYEDGSSKRGEVTLTLEEGRWKLGLIRSAG